MLIAQISSINNQNQPCFQSKNFFNRFVNSVARDVRVTFKRDVSELKTFLNKEIVVGEPLLRVSDMAEAWKKKINQNYEPPKKSLFKKCQKFFGQLLNNEGWIRLK